MKTITTNIFLDTEFTDLNRGAELISLALVAEDGRYLYAELTDFDRENCSDFVKGHILPILTLEEQPNGVVMNDGNVLYKGDKAGLAEQINLFVSKYGKVHIWADNHSWDWMLFCDLYGHAFNIPKNIFYIVFDIATLLLAKGFDPDVSRHSLVEMGNLPESIQAMAQHHALYDAYVELEVYRDLINKGI